MKSFALLAAFALLAFAVPSSAKPPLLQYCLAVQGTSCTILGATMGCTDVCSNQLSCTCVYDYGNPSVWYWNCDWEC
ncbi:MAG TPA: hypothetical protein VF756_00740 [Thermoanaerobaculia bacterium]